MTRINIISGFLGAGKTTLIKKMLSEVFSGQKIVLIENEFGEIGIDGGFLKDSGVEITEMNSGCICCSLVGDFGTALKEVLKKFNPDRVIIEPSGVGKLSDVIKAVEKVAEDIEVELDHSITVADANKCKIYMKNFGEFFNNQIEYADIIVLSRTQNIKQDKLEMCVKMLQEHNSKAPIITTPWEQLDGKMILNSMNEKKMFAEELLKKDEVCPECGHHHDHDHAHEEHHHEHGECSCGHDHSHHHHADEVFTSWGKETPHRYVEEELRNALEILANETGYGTILRAKGIVSGADGVWFQFDLVPGEYEIRKSSPDYTGKLCVIGSQLDTQKLEVLFQLV